MLKSMTGYGRGEFANEYFNIIIEIKSVNHRYSDINVKMPRHINFLEEKIKKAVREKISRGKVDVYINLEYINDTAVDVKVDIPLAKAYKEKLEQLIDELKLDENVKLFNILSLPEIIRTEKKETDEELLWMPLKNALEEALEKIMEMKVVEGEAIKDDMLSKLSEIERLVDDIELRAPNVVLEYKNKLKDRIEELLGNEVKIDEERLAQEVAIFADKSNINEELVRLKSHINQFRKIVNEDDAVGRKLDFLIQEMNRETNTISSKANDIFIANNVVLIKAEIEKIREQVQNIE
ncbi:MAG TPA: YicC/YloC family endoribonuclease [Tissierellaceae bacterium]